MEDSPDRMEKPNQDDAKITPATKSVRETIDHLLQRNVSKPDRDDLGKALDKANAPETGRTADGSHRAPNSKAFG
jgi:hypothetical protein